MITAKQARELVEAYELTYPHRLGQWKRVALEKVEAAARRGRSHATVFPDRECIRDLRNYLRKLGFKAHSDSWTVRIRW